MEKEKRDLVLAVAGLGYVGLSLAVLLSQHHKVYAVDVDPRRVEEVGTGPLPDFRSGTGTLLERSAAPASGNTGCAAGL